MGRGTLPIEGSLTWIQAYAFECAAAWRGAVGGLCHTDWVHRPCVDAAEGSDVLSDGHHGFECICG